MGTHIANHESFEQRNYGFKKLSDLFANIDLFELKKAIQNCHGLEIRKNRRQIELS